MAHEDELLANYFGKIVLRNCNISHYKKKQGTWRNMEGAAEKRRELFQDILEDKPPAEDRKLESQIGQKRKGRGSGDEELPVGIKINKVYYNHHRT